MALGRLTACPNVVHNRFRAVACHGSARYSRCHISLVRKTPGYSMKGVPPSSRILSLLVLKPCDLVELTCDVGSKAMQAVVKYLEGVHNRAANSLQKAVTAELLANSIQASRLAQGLSDELSSIIWWPRRAVELYDVCSLHPDFPAAFASSKPLHIFDSLVGCGQALQEKELEAIRSKLPQAALIPAQGIRPSTEVNADHSLRKSVRLDSVSSAPAAFVVTGWKHVPCLHCKQQTRYDNKAVCADLICHGTTKPCAVDFCH